MGQCGAATLTPSPAKSPVYILSQMAVLETRQLQN